MSGQWVLVNGVRRSARSRGQHLHVVKARPESNHQDPFATAYRSPVGDGYRRESWAEYLRRMTERPGWSVARLARDSHIHRATIFKWMAGKGGANVASVRAIAEALGDDPANALRAAGNIDAAPEETMDPDLKLLMRRLADPDAPEAEKTAIRAALRYLAELAEKAEQSDRPGRTLRRRSAS